MENDIPDFWKHGNWNQPLNNDSIISYFQKSPFYDKASNNTKPYYKTIPGLYYELIHSYQSRLFIIKRVDRKPDGSEVITQYYYIIDSVVYKAPNVGSLLRTKLFNMVSSISKVLTCYMASTKAEEPDDIDYSSLT
jgi:hypothetical protein